MTLHVKSEFWDIKEILGLRGTEFSTAISFTNLESKQTHIFPAISDQNEIWQVGDTEFMVLSGCELFHIGIFREKGIETFFRKPANSYASLFDDSYICFEDFTGFASIYVVAERLELSKILENLIDPLIHVSIEKPCNELPMLVCISAPHLVGRFLLRKEPLDLSFWDCTVGWVRHFKQFVQLAKERCKEIRTAKYYEKCGGYLIDDKLVRGIFTQKFYGDSVAYEFIPDNFFNRVAIPRLLAENGLVEVTPKKPCVFFGEPIETSKYSIGLTQDVLIIVEHADDGDKTYALEMYGQACLGLRQVKDDAFLAITSVCADESDAGFVQLRHFAKNGATGNFFWDDSSISTNGKNYISAVSCQLDSDTILFEKEPKTHASDHHLDMWSISKDRMINLTDVFCDVFWPKGNQQVAHTEKQLLVRPIGKGYVDKQPQILLAVRLYQPKQFCDVFALIDPRTKYRVFGKVYNMLADSMTSRPRVVNDLIKLLFQNEQLKSLALEHLSTLNTPS